MKRWGIFILTLAMLFAVAGAEEVFMEESFLDAGVQGEEFFSEESFFGDAFEAEAPEEGAEAEAEDRSVFLMETETLPDAALTNDWQKWYVKVTPDAMKPGKKTITLNFGLFTDEACTTAAPSVKLGSGAYAGVKFYIYAVHPYTGIPEEVPKKATAAMKTKITVKNPGDYTFYARLEKADQNGSETYGRASEKVTVTVEPTTKDYAITKVKFDVDRDSYEFYAETDAVPGKPEIVARYYNDYIDICAYTKKAADRYLITAQTQGGEIYTGTLSLYSEDKIWAFINGYFWFDLDDVWWGYNVDTKKHESIPAPIFTSKGKKLTLTITPQIVTGEEDPVTGIIPYDDVGKAKKATLKLEIFKKFTAKTPPMIMEVEQIDATTVWLRWFDPASFYFFKPTGYILSYGKTKVPVTMDKILADGEGVYSYELVMAAPVSNPTKMTFTVQATTDDKVKPKKSKGWTEMILPQSGFYVYDVDSSNFYYREDKVTHEYYSGVDVTWKSLYDTADSFEVYLTDDKHTTDVAKKKISADKSKTESYDKDNERYFVEFRRSDYEALTDGRRLGIVVKALAKDGSILGRASSGGYYNNNYLRAVTIEQKKTAAEYKGYNFTGGDLFKAVDADGSSYPSAVTFKKILYTPDGTTPETEVEYIRNPGKYKITIESSDGYQFTDPKVTEEEYAFEVEKRKLNVSPIFDTFVIAEPTGYAFSKYDLLIENGDEEHQGDNYTILNNAVITVKNSKGEAVADNLIKEPGEYTAEVIITADPANTDGLTPTADPIKGTMTVTVEFTVSAKKLYINAKPTQSGWVGKAQGGDVYPLGYRITDVNDYDVLYSPYSLSSSDLDVTFAVTNNKDGKEIKLGDISKQAGEYTVVINAKCEGWEDAEPVTVTVTIFETQKQALEYVDDSSHPYGNLTIFADNPQYKIYDGGPKIPDFKILDEAGKEVDAKYYVSIYDADGKKVDSANDIGYYEVVIFTDEPGYGNTGVSIDLYITKAWEMNLKETTFEETSSAITPEFTAMAGTTPLAIMDPTQTTYVYYEYYPESLKKDGKDYKYNPIQESGTYTFEVSAWVYTKTEGGTHELDITYAPIERKVYTLTITPKFTLTMTTASVVENGKDLATTGYADGVLKFVAANSKGDIKPYSEDPTGWKLDSIGSIERYYDDGWGLDWHTTYYIDQAGEYRFKAEATWDSVTKVFDFTLKVTDAWTLKPAKTELTANGTDLYDKSLFKAETISGSSIADADWSINYYYVYLLDEEDRTYRYAYGGIVKAGYYKVRVNATTTIDSVSITKTIDVAGIKVKDTWTVVQDESAKKISLKLPAIGDDIFKEQKFNVTKADGTVIPLKDSVNPQNLYYEIVNWRIYKGTSLITDKAHASDSSYELKDEGTYRIQVETVCGGPGITGDLYDKSGYPYYYDEFTFTVTKKE
ncbi:MAG: hypothetical protein K5746_07870 [Clostridiales bacterium]|nr:hypothetical protein [Clostridiales bacterium]